MKNDDMKMRVGVLTVAVQGALLAMCAMPAHAEEDELATLLKPKNTVEVGVANTSSSSAKFGEYSGMNKSGVDFVGNFNLNGGDSYGDNTGSKRWSITGTDLGLTSRAVGASVKDQGKWNFGISYDELTHYTSDSYQTPYLGSIGGNSFALPAGFGTINTTAATAVVFPAAVNPPVGTMSAAGQAKIAGALHNVPVSNDRKNTSLTAGLVLNEQWSIKFDFNHLAQSGAKLMGFGSMANAAQIAGVTGEAVSFLPNPTNYKTDTFNLGLNWVGEQGHMSASYFGSMFREGYDRVAFQTFAVTTGAINATELMSTAPSNDLHQLNLNGGYAFSPKTKLTGGLSYGRNTQNDSYVYDTYSMAAGFVMPQTSLNGLVNTTHADLKLTDQTTANLLLSAGIKFDERRDRSASNFYQLNAISGSTAHIGNFANAPFSNRKTQLELAGDYRLTKEQNLRFAYNREQVSRWCDQYAAKAATTVGTVPGLNSYPVGTNCVVATGSHEDKLSATYRVKASEDLNLNAGYSYAKRVTASDPNAITARIGLNGNANLATAATATNIQGLNAGDYLGFYPFFSASRREQMIKVGANWQATEKFALDVGGKFTDDKYDSAYGVTNGSSWSVNLDATYAYSANSSATVYLSQQQRQRDMTDLYRAMTAAPTAAAAGTLNIPQGATWSDRQKDIDTTIGVGAKKSGLMGSKLELDGDLTYTIGRTDYNTQFNYAAATSGTGGLPVMTCASPQFLTCGALPEIKNEVIQLKLVGKYSLDKMSKVSVGYLYQQMKSTDFYYNGLQIGATPSALMPTNQQSPNYTVNVVTASYIHDF